MCIKPFFWGEMQVYKAVMLAVCNVVSHKLFFLSQELINIGEKHWSHNQLLRIKHII